MPHYKAKYIPRKTAPQGSKEYWRTITGVDDLNHAIKQAERFTRKHYICVGVQSHG